MKSIFGSDGRRFYTLVHKVSSQYHKAGESQQIIVDQIELGRDPSCQVRFDESFNTVSRRHAAIVKDGDNWKLVQLSKTNSTYLNGRRVQNEWYLQNGDEIQLSTNGPKLGFIVPEGKNGLVRSINLTARLNLFRQQALRPYKTALWSLAAVLLLVVGFGGYFLKEAVNDAREAEKAVVIAEERWAEEKAAMEVTLKELDETNKKLAEDSKKKDVAIKALDGQVKELQKRSAPSVNSIECNDAINACLPYIFFIQTVGFEIIAPNGERIMIEAGKDGAPSWTGTGFLLNDGRFVTARHVSEAWYFWQDGSGVNEQLLAMNQIVNVGGRVIAYFMAVSSSGKTLEFKSDQFVCDRSQDRRGTLEDNSVASLAILGNTDFAYIRNMSSSNRGLKYDSQRSRELKRGESLVVLGFPLGLGANAIDDIEPILGSGMVAAPGLQQGCILTTDTNYEQGNSGGPVFCTNSDGSLSVVGIVSAGAGRSTGFVVPISVINR